MSLFCSFTKMMANTYQLLTIHTQVGVSVCCGCSANNDAIKRRVLGRARSCLCVPTSQCKLGKLSQVGRVLTQRLTTIVIFATTAAGWRKRCNRQLVTWKWCVKSRTSRLATMFLTSSALATCNVKDHGVKQPNKGNAILSVVHVYWLRYLTKWEKCKNWCASYLTKLFREKHSQFRFSISTVREKIVRC